MLVSSQLNFNEKNYFGGKTKKKCWKREKKIKIKKKFSTFFLEISFTFLLWEIKKEKNDSEKKIKNNKHIQSVLY